MFNQVHVACVVQQGVGTTESVHDAMEAETLSLRFKALNVDTVMEPVFSAQHTQSFAVNVLEKARLT